MYEHALQQQQQEESLFEEEDDAWVWELDPSPAKWSEGNEKHVDHDSMSVDA